MPACQVKTPSSMRTSSENLCRPSQICPIRKDKFVICKKKKKTKYFPQEVRQRLVGTAAAAMWNCLVGYGKHLQLHRRSHPHPHGFIVNRFFLNIMKTYLLWLFLGRRRYYFCFFFGRHPVEFACRFLNADGILSCVYLVCTGAIG